MPAFSHALIAAPAAFAVLALFSIVLGAARIAFRQGLLAGACGYVAVQALWAASPHSPWVNLIFQLFPAPVAYETARLIFVLLVVKPPLAGKAAPFAFGFALFVAFASLGASVLADGVTVEGAATLPLLTLAMHALFSFAAFAMVRRGWPIFAPFTILAIAHGATRGGLLAIHDELARIVTEAALALAFGALAFWLAKLDALRQEDRRRLG
jgi:hypothetical protein